MAITAKERDILRGGGGYLSLAALCLSLAAGLAAFAAAPEVTDVTARQRYPWNGLVDITCNVTGIDGETNGLKFAVAAVMPDSGNARSARNFWVVQGGTNSTDREVHTNGSYRLLWDARADMGIVRYTNMVVRVTLDAHEKVQLWEGGPYWATTNIGAENPEDYGYYFWWGDTVGYKREGNAWVAADGSSSNFSFDESNAPTYCKDLVDLASEGWIGWTPAMSAYGGYFYVLALEHDVAHVQWGGDWRMPTKQEFDDLCNKCDWTSSIRNGVIGYVVRGRGDYVSNRIFLPCAGYGDGFSLNNSGSNGNYWSSVASDYDLAGYLDFSASRFYNGRLYYSGHNYTGYFYRYFGFSVRPVQGFTK